MAPWPPRLPRSGPLWPSAGQMLSISQSQLRISRPGLLLQSQPGRCCRVAAPRPRTNLRAAEEQPEQPEQPQASSSSFPQDLPDALKGLKISDDGQLVDEKTGKVINEFGATRFDVAVRAMRGELDPPAWQENTEREAGIILRSLMQFPTDYMFQVVGQPSKQPGCSKEQFVSDMVSVVEAVCQEQLAPSNLQVVDRLGGKYVSLKMTCRVRAPELVSAVFQKLEGDVRVTMKF